MSLAIDIALRMLLAYLLGSVNGSLLLGRLRGVDIRTMGSGNAGGTNALRTQGLAFALAVVVIDVLKGYFAVRMLSAGGGVPWLPEACAAAAIVGHVYPVFHGFRGGKGAATLIGAIAALAPELLLVILGVWLLSMLVTGYVGLSTMIAAASLPVALVWRGTEPGSIRVLWLLGIALFVVYTHRGNIARMRAGTEPRSKRLWLLGRLRGAGS